MVGLAPPSEIPLNKPIFCLKFDSPNPKAPPQGRACAEVYIRYCPLSSPFICWTFCHVGLGDKLRSLDLVASTLTQWAISLGYFTFWESILDQELTNQGWLRSKARDPPVSCRPLVLGLQEHAMASSFPRVYWSHEHCQPALLTEPSPQSRGIIFRTVTLRNKCLCGPGLVQHRLALGKYKPGQICLSTCCLPFQHFHGPQVKLARKSRQKIKRGHVIVFFYGSCGGRN